MGSTTLKSWLIGQRIEYGSEKVLIIGLEDAFTYTIGLVVRNNIGVEFVVPLTEDTVFCL